MTYVMNKEVTRLKQEYNGIGTRKVSTIPVFG